MNENQSKLNQMKFNLIDQFDQMIYLDWIDNLEYFAFILQSINRAQPYTFCKLRIT